jgi:GTPase
MVMLQKTEIPPKAIREFTAEGTHPELVNIVMILYHQTTIKPKYQSMLHVNATAQTCQIMSIEEIHRNAKNQTTITADDPDGQILRTGDRGLVRFRFMQRAEYLKEGTKLIFREGRTKGLGTVKHVFPVKDPVAISDVKTPARISTKDGTTKNHARQGTGDPGKAVKSG